MKKSLFVLFALITIFSQVSLADIQLWDGQNIPLSDGSHVYCGQQAQLLPPPPPPPLILTFSCRCQNTKKFVGNVIATGMNESYAVIRAIGLCRAEYGDPTLTVDPTYCTQQ